MSILSFFLVILSSLALLTIKAKSTIHDHFPNSAQTYYEEAFIASFNGERQKAREASEQAAQLDHGNKHWSYEAKGLLGLSSF